MLIYKDEVLNEPGNVDFGSEDISGIGDGTVTGAISKLNSKMNFVKNNSLISFSDKDPKLRNTSDTMLVKHNDQFVNICIAVQFNEEVSTPGIDYILGNVSDPKKRPKLVHTSLSFTNTCIVSLRVETNGNIVARVLNGTFPIGYAAWFDILYLCV